MSIFPTLNNRLLTTILLLLLVFITNQGVNAKQAQIDGMTYFLDVSKKTAELMPKKKGHYSMDVVIPSTVRLGGENYTVTAIGENAFAGCSGLTGVEIPTSVMIIGNGAFSGCSSLTSIEIPSSVTTVGDYAFSGCSSLISIEIPSSVTAIGISVFSGCSGMTSIGIPASVMAIGDFAFSGCNGLTSIEIPTSVMAIGNYAFSGCSSLASVEIPALVMTIRDHAFSGCSSLTSIEIPSSVTAIEDYAFSGCSSLTSIEIPSSVTAIGSFAFSGCENLVNVELSEDAIISPDTFSPKAKITYFNRLESWEDLNKYLLTWEQYYHKYKKYELNFKDVKSIEARIKQDINEWQVKDEFESTDTWRQRVNDASLHEKAVELGVRYLEVYKDDVENVSREQKIMAKDYERYKNRMLKRFYSDRIALAIKEFAIANFDLKPYDADNQTFLIHGDSFGDILLPVPLAEAPSFKENWVDICHSIRPEFVPNGENVALNKLVFINNGKNYIYDSHTVANYAITDVDYNFAPVEMSEINFADIEVDGFSAITGDVSSSVVGLNSQGAGLAQRVYTPSRVSVSASDRSDVDTSIPQNGRLEDSTTFAVIIANEKYNSVSSVPYAENDGAVLSKYLVNAIGLPEEHVKVYNNATFGNMAAALRHMDNLSLAFGDKLNLILYYAGHGVPDEQTRRCMLLPVDGDATIPETCYDVDKLYSVLGGYNANSVVVMMDACFCGSVRGDDMLFASRGVRIKSSHSSPTGNMVVFSASQGDESAFPFDQERHGLFTYYLLKKLQESQGDVTLGELGDYLVEQVKRQSVVSNGKLQTPVVHVGVSVKDVWKDWRLGR